MEVPGLGSVNNSIRLDPNRITTPEVTPGRVTPEKSPQAPLQQPITLPNQAPKSPVLTQNLQAFSSLLSEMGIPDTPQNNQLVQVLANYGQPVNRQTMTQVALAMGPLIQAGPVNIEAAVVLMINAMPINKQSVDAVKHLLNSGGLSQNLLGFSKDLQKLVENFSNKKTVQFSGSGEITTIQAPVNNVRGLLTTAANQQLVGQTAVTGSKQHIENIKPDSTAIKIQDGKVDEISAAMKNPYGEEEAEEDIVNRNPKEQKSDGKSQQMITEKGLVRVETGEIKINNQVLANELSVQAQKINKNIMNLLTIDVLKNPAQFPMQIAMLRKSFAELEIDIKDFKELIRKNFPGILEEKPENGEKEDIFTDLLKLIVSDEEPSKVKQLKTKTLKNPAAFDAGIIKDIARAAESINLNMLGRELLTRSMDCMCLPLSIPFNGKLYQVEVMIRREDQSNKKTEIGHVPIRIQLAIETKTLGKVGVDISNLKRDLRVNLSVENKFIQKRMQATLEKLNDSLNTLPFDLAPIQCVVNPRPDESPSILLPHKYKVMSMRRIEGIV